VKTNNGSFRSEFVKIKDEKWLGKQRIAGRVAAGALSLLENLVKERTTSSLIELDKIAEEYIIDNGCSNTFLNYHGFPNSVCISVNKQLVHGIPTDYILVDGDLVSFDLGVTFENVIADTAITCYYGDVDPKHILGINTTYEALYAGISVAKVGNRIGAIGNAIFKYARDKEFKVIENYGGHSMEENIPHAQPFIPNRSLLNEGIRIQNNMTLAIEPMLVPYSCPINTKVGNDGWSVYTEEPGYHFEHTIYISNDNIEVITKRENEK